jgi:methylthioribose-1-phosphate isomerase
MLTAAPGKVKRDMPSFETIAWRDGTLVLLDQRRLPAVEEYLTCRRLRDAAEAIRSMVVRGAPAIGVTAAYALALAAAESPAADVCDLRRDLDRAAAELKATRPTAVNLAWAVDRVLAGLGDTADPGALRRQVLDAAERMHREDVAANRALGRHGAELLADGDTVLTHCNAGALATAGYGTALGVIRAAVEAGKRVAVLADETRPFLQGARLTAWELQRDGIPVTVITDGMAGWALRSGRVQAVVVGADRIARNGDTANKIGTYQVAVLARENRVPFYVAAPTSTIDLATPTGDGIPIEQRDPAEVTGLGPARVVPEGVQVLNPAFDVTPARYLSAIVTERGVARPPFERSLVELAG